MCSIRRWKRCIRTSLQLKHQWSAAWASDVTFLWLTLPMALSYSYQQPETAKKDLLAPPSLPLQNYHLEPSRCMFVCSESQQLHLKSLEVLWDMAHKFESATRQQSSSKRPLTASRFREICQVRESSEDSLADHILQGTRQTAAMKSGLEMEADAILEYCQIKSESLPLWIWNPSWCPLVGGISRWVNFWPFRAMSVWFDWNKMSKC